MHVCIYACMHLRMYVRTYVCMHAYNYVRECMLSVYACMHACTCVYICMTIKKGTYCFQKICERSNPWLRINCILGHSFSSSTCNITHQSTNAVIFSRYTCFFLTFVELYCYLQYYILNITHHSTNTCCSHEIDTCLYIFIYIYTYVVLRICPRTLQCFLDI